MKHSFHHVNSLYLFSALISETIVRIFQNPLPPLCSARLFDRTNHQSNGKSKWLSRNYTKRTAFIINANVFGILFICITFNEDFRPFEELGYFDHSYCPQLPSSPQAGHDLHCSSDYQPSPRHFMSTWVAIAVAHLSPCLYLLPVDRAIFHFTNRSQINLFGCIPQVMILVNLSDPSLGVQKNTVDWH